LTRAGSAGDKSKKITPKAKRTKNHVNLRAHQQGEEEVTDRGKGGDDHNSRRVAWLARRWGIWGREVKKGRKKP